MSALTKPAFGLSKISSIPRIFKLSQFIPLESYAKLRLNPEHEVNMHHRIPHGDVMCRHVVLQNQIIVVEHLFKEPYNRGN